MPKALLDAIDKQAETEFRNRSDLIREAVRTYIASKGGMSTSYKLSKTEESRIKTALDFANLKLEPSIILSGTFRPQPNSIKDLFDANSKIIKLLESPPNMRRMGWDLQTLDRAKPVGGDFLELTNGKRKLLRLYRDGQFIFAAGMDFFGHGVNKGEETDPNFNLLSVTELIQNFVNFTQLIADELQTKSDLNIFTISVSNPNREKLSLHAYDGFSTEKVGEMKIDWAVRDNVIKTEDKLTNERIAYQIYSEFSYFFGLRSDQFWYVDHKKREIDKSSFLKQT